MKQKQIVSAFKIDEDLKVFLKIQSAKTNISMAEHLNKILRNWKNEVEAENAEAVK